MGLLDLLQQAVGGNPEAHFDQVVQNASTDQLGAGLAAAMRSDQTPPSGDLVGKLFNVSSSSQQAGMQVAHTTPQGTVADYRQCDVAGCEPNQ